MFKDIQLSKTMQSEFLQHLGGANTSLGVDFSTEVLTNGTWPQMDTPPCTLPMELKSCQDRFDRYFKTKNTNKTLTWLFQHGQVELTTTYTKKKYQLITNVFQASILCLFNEDNEITCAQIKNRTQIT